MENKYTAIPPGKWRAVLKLQNQVIDVKPVEKKKQILPQLPELNFEEVTGGELPFQFEVIYEENGIDFYLEIINGEERIPVRDISFGRNKSRAKDSIRINFPVYESYIIAWYEENALEGHWFVPTRGIYAIPFVAKYGKDHRFTVLEKEPSLDISGNWEVHFTDKDGSSYPAIGEFEQNGNYLKGTFRTETGDYRFLEGTVQADKLYLSCFDGSHAFLFEAKIQENETILGTFRSGKHYSSVWEAKRNPNFEMGNADTLTYLREGYETVEFEFETPDGKILSPQNEDRQGKVQIIQIFGTWCPNCSDETAFLVNYLQKNKHPDLKVMALAFEKYREKEKAFKTIRTYQEHFKMNYDIAYAGYYNKKEAAQSLPMLNHILSYPTLIFLDKQGNVRKIHTGFSGPATSQYEAFVQDFEATVNQLLAE